MVKITAGQEQRLREIIGRGLIAGIGSETGQTCIEGAIALSIGERLTTTPSCVGNEDRNWAILINDAPWSSPAARAEALLPIALAQTGSAGTDRTVWVLAVALGTIRRVLPLALRAAGMVDEADACSIARDLPSARLAAAAAARTAKALRAGAAEAVARAAAMGAWPSPGLLPGEGSRL